MASGAWTDTHASLAHSCTTWTHWIRLHLHKHFGHAPHKHVSWWQRYHYHKKLLRTHTLPDPCPACPDAVVDPSVATSHFESPCQEHVIRTCSSSACVSQSQLLCYFLLTFSFLLLKALQQSINNINSIFLECFNLIWNQVTWLIIISQHICN